jgi:hypothetical protein
MSVILYDTIDTGNNLVIVEEENGALAVCLVQEIYNADQVKEADLDHTGIYENVYAVSEDNTPIYLGKFEKCVVNSVEYYEV